MWNGPDILTPLFLCPNFDNLYVMDLFDYCYTFNNNEPTIFDQRKIIINALKLGRNKFYSHFNNKEKNFKLSKSKIIYNSDKKSKNPNYFHLQFLYQNKVRNLYFYTIDYIKEQWPEDISNIKTILAIGSPFRLDIEILNCIPFCEIYNSTYKKYKKLIKTRTNINFNVIIYPGWGILDKFTQKSYNGFNYYYYNANNINDNDLNYLLLESGNIIYYKLCEYKSILRELFSYSMDILFFWSNEKISYWYNYDSENNRFGKYKIIKLITYIRMFFIYLYEIISLIYLMYII